MSNDAEMEAAVTS